MILVVEICGVLPVAVPAVQPAAVNLDGSLALVSGSLGFVVLLQPQPQLPWIFIITFLADWLQIHLIEFRF